MNVFLSFSNVNIYIARSQRSQSTEYLNFTKIVMSLKPTVPFTFCLQPRDTPVIASNMSKQAQI